MGSPFTGIISSSSNLLLTSSIRTNGLSPLNVNIALFPLSVLIVSSVFKCVFCGIYKGYIMSFNILLVFSSLVLFSVVLFSFPLFSSFCILFVVVVVVSPAFVVVVSVVFCGFVVVLLLSLLSILSCSDFKFSNEKYLSLNLAL